MVPVEFSFRAELNAVQAHLRQEIQFKAAEFEELVHLDMDELDRTICPAIVLAVSQACGNGGRKPVALAAIVQFIFMADQVHQLMKDNLDVAEEHRQFPVLVGDFLYGKFFLELCREKLLPFLEPLAQVIGTMSEGGIARWLSKDKKLSTEEWLQILEQERAVLTSIAARLSAELAGVSLFVQDKFESLGWELGLAWGAWRESLENSVVQSILHRANAILNEIPANDQFHVQPLREVMNYLSGYLSIDFDSKVVGS